MSGVTFCNVTKISLDMKNRNVSIITTIGIKLSSISKYMPSFMHWAWDSPFLSRFYKIIYWEVVDKLKKIGKIMFMLFLSLAFKDGGKTHNGGQVGLLMMKRGWNLPRCKLWKKNRCFLVALYRLILRGANLEVATKRFLHRLVKILR